MTDFRTLLEITLQARHQGRPLILFLDYDGTLVEIAPRPELARPSKRLLELLDQLAAQEYLKVIVVSSRSLKELQELLPVPGLDFLGSYGGEVFIFGRPYLLQAATMDRNELLHWRNRLVARLKPFQGWRIDDKPLGFAIHYRQVPPEQTYEFIGALGRWKEQLRQAGLFQILGGKKIQEILPQWISKGAAVQEILSLLPRNDSFFPIYVGDDASDESAFQILQNLGLTIKVGHPGTKTAAFHFLPDPEAVLRLLSLLVDARIPPEDLK